MGRVAVFPAGHLAVMLAAANFVARTSAWTHELATSPAWRASWGTVAGFWLPAPLLLAAAVLARRDRGTSWWVAAAGLAALPGGLAMGSGLFAPAGWRLVGPGPLWYAKRYSVLPPWSYGPAVAALVPAAVGWWHRRRERPIEGGDA